MSVPPAPSLAEIPPARLLLAMAWMSLAILSFTAMAVAGREIQTEMNTFELMFYRSAIGWLVIVAVIALRGGGFGIVRTAHPGMHVRRNLVHFAGQNAWFYAVAAIPLAQVVSIEMTNPIWVAVLAPFLLAEKLTPAKIVAALLGFLGVLVVVRPGSAVLDWGHVAALGAALGFAFNTMFTKQIMRFDPVMCVLFWMTLSQTVMGFLLALPGGIPWPSPAVLPWVLVVGVAGLSAHLGLTSALGVAPATVVAPMEFLRLPVLATVGMWLYGEPLHLAVLGGAALIIAGNIVNLRAQARQGRRA
jgi:drug/metabolite transporter (DMT)-like permease